MCERERKAFQLVVSAFVSVRGFVREGNPRTVREPNQLQKQDDEAI